MAIVYVSPTGSGSKAGTSISDALPVTGLDKAIQLAGAGGTVRMLADQGAYNVASGISIAHGGSAVAPVKIIGVDSAGHEMNIHVNGTRSTEFTAGTAAGNETFKLLAGANNLVFENMTFANVGSAFRAGANIDNVVIQDMAADNVGRFFEDYLSGSNTSATVSDLTIRNVEVHGFSSNVIRLQYNSNNIVIDNVWGDSEGQNDGDIAIGIHLDGTVHDVVIRNSTMMNARSPVTDYWNGDGFATERGVYNVTFENTKAIGNADGGYDLKSTATTLINAVAEDNGRNFRLWADATLVNPTGVDPHKWGGSIGGQFQIQIMSGAKVTVTGGSFADSGSATAVVANDGGTVTFNGTSFIYALGGRLTSGTGILGIDSDLVKTVAATGIFSINGEDLMGPPPSANHAPVILSAADTGLLTEWADKSVSETANTPHTAWGFVTYEDADQFDLHTASVKAKGSGYLGTLSLDTDTIDLADVVRWSFSVSDKALESMSAGQSKTQLYDVAINDGHGGLVHQTITITLAGADDAGTSGTRAPRTRASDSTPTPPQPDLPDDPAGHGRRDRAHAAETDRSHANDSGAPELTTILGAHLHLNDHVHM